ncbi:unnamed protein product [Caenorhabditis brenneri]
MIKVLKLPYLVQLEIFRLMCFTDIFTLSLCSSRMYKLIKCCKFEIARLCYKEHKNGFWVYNRYDDNHNEYIVFVRAVRKYRHESDQTRVTFGGVIIDLQWRTYGIEYIDETTGPIQTMAQNHINGLFHLSDIDLELCSENLKQDHCPAFSNATDILFNGDVTKSSTFHRILHMHPNLKSVHLNEIDGGVPENSILYKIDEVSTKLCLGLAPNFMNNFSGSRAHLDLVGLNETDVINCVTDWISGRKYHNLVELQLDQGEKKLNADTIWNSLRPLAKTTRMPDTYEGSFRYLKEDGNEIYLGCVGYKKASIFFNYILDLFRAEITEIVLNLNKLVDIKQFLSDPLFKNVQNITLVGGSVDSKKVIELYDCFDKPVVQSYIDANIKSPSPTSRMLQSENLVSYPTKLISIEHLLNFSGKYITLECSSFLEKDIIAFIKHWLDGNYPSLEGAVISRQLGWEFDTEKILNEFKTKQWNPEERAQNFLFNASNDRDEKYEFPIKDCSNGFDLERSDGLLATMQFGKHHHDFYFFVWHTRFP